MVVGSSLGRGIWGFTENIFIQLSSPSALAMVLALFLSMGVGALEEPGGVETQDIEASGGSGSAAVRSGTDETAGGAAAKILPRSRGDALSDSATLPGSWETLSEQIEHLVRVGLAVEKWCAEHGALPETLEEVVEAGEYLDEIPEDVYAPGRRLSYRHVAEKQFGIIYSYGPDGDDDSGVSIPVYPFGTPGPIPDGDIVFQVHLSDVVRERNPLLKRFDASFYNQSLLDALLYMKEQDGRDNAMIHYVAAGRLMPSYSEWPDSDLVGKVLERGWDEEADKLLPHLAKWQPMLKTIRQGASVGYARNSGLIQRPGTRLPDGLGAWEARRILYAEGRYLESQSKYEDALENYLTALTMGRDYGSPGGNGLQIRMSVTAQGYALESIYRLVTTDILDRPVLDRLAAGLREIERTPVSITDAYQNDYLGDTWVFEEMKLEPDAIGKYENRPEKREVYEDALQQPERIRRERKRLWDFELVYLETPYWERNFESFHQEWEALIGTVHPVFESHFYFDCLVEEPDVRYRAMMAELCLTRIVTALAAYKLDHEGSPEQLFGLVPDYLESVPIDPFGGKEFSGLYSVGPDREDDGGEVQYDSSNGTISRGDVYLR